VRLYILGDATQRAGRQSAVRSRGWRHFFISTNHVQARACVEGDVRCVLPSSRSLIGRRHQCGAAVVAASDHQSRREIGSVLAPKYRDVSLEYRPQTDTGLQPSIIKQERRACDTVRDPQVAVRGRNVLRAPSSDTATGRSCERRRSGRVLFDDSVPWRVTISSYLGTVVSCPRGTPDSLVYSGRLAAQGPRATTRRPKTQSTAARRPRSLCSCDRLSRDDRDDLHVVWIDDNDLVFIDEAEAPARKSDRRNSMSARSAAEFCRRLG
jgi:hypothetical protein